MADETGAPPLGDCGGVEVVLETVPRRMRAACWTGSNLESVMDVAGDTWRGLSEAGNPLIEHTDELVEMRGPGWWVTRDLEDQEGLVVLSPEAARLALRLPTDTTNGSGCGQGGTHPDLSWSCWHAAEDGRPELHGYCQNVDGQAGPKIPARCKWCPSPCSCSCHDAVPEVPGG